MGEEVKMATQSSVATRICHDLIAEVPPLASM